MMSAQHVIEAAGGKAICLEKRSQVTNEQVYHIKAKEKDPVFMIISQPLARNESDLREPEPAPKLRTIINAKVVLVLVIPLIKFQEHRRKEVGLKRSKHGVNGRTLNSKKKTNVVDKHTSPGAVLAQSSCMASMGK